jgi:hypothetical protein
MTFNVIAAILALFVLKPMRARHFAKGDDAFTAASGGVASTRAT